jgi:shikimate 5-dehydrogenase
LTPFLELARDAGKGQVADGVGMLVEQAAEAFVWWRGVPARHARDDSPNSDDTARVTKPASPSRARA